MKSFMLMVLDPGKQVGIVLWRVGGDEDGADNETRLMLMAVVDHRDAKYVIELLWGYAWPRLCVVEDSPADRGMSWADQTELIASLKTVLRTFGCDPIMVKASIWQQALAAMKARGVETLTSKRLAGTLEHARDAARIGDWFISAGKHLQLERKDA